MRVSDWRIVVTLPAGDGTNALFVPKIVDRRRNLETASGLNATILLTGKIAVIAS